MTDFARIVTLACHDLRTPLATVRGFAKTLQRTAPEEGPEARYLELIDSASAELAHLLDLLGLVARVESGRHELTPVAANTAAIARAAAAAAGGVVEVVGEGEDAAVDAPLVEQALAAYARCALRHGGLDAVELRVEGTRYMLGPVDATIAPILLGDELRDLGSAACTRILRALGGTVEVVGGALVVAPPTGSGATS